MISPEGKKRKESGGLFDDLAASLGFANFGFDFFKDFEGDHREGAGALCSGIGGGFFALGFLGVHFFFVVGDGGAEVFGSFEDLAFAQADLTTVDHRADIFRVRFQGGVELFESFVILFLGFKDRTQGGVVVGDVGVQGDKTFEDGRGFGVLPLVVEEVALVGPCQEDIIGKVEEILERHITVDECLQLFLGDGRFSAGFAGCGGWSGDFLG